MKETHIIAITPQAIIDKFGCSKEIAERIIADLCFETTRNLEGHLNRLAFEYKLTKRIKQ